MQVGQYAYRFENFMTKSIVKDENVLTEDKSDEKAKKEIGETRLNLLNPDAAFNKGIDYATELTLLYGALVAFAIYEARKAIEKSKKEKEKHFNCFRLDLIV